MDYPNQLVHKIMDQANEITKLKAELENLRGAQVTHYCENCGKLTAELARYKTAEAEERIIPAGDRGNVSDGYHTFDELYDQRAILFSAICRAYPERAWKSKLHSDGTMFENHFIVGITTPKGQYTYHYGMSKWDWFPITEIDHAPEWDGHTDKDAQRLWAICAKSEAYKCAYNEAVEQCGSFCIGPCDDCSYAHEATEAALKGDVET